MSIIRRTALVGAFSALAAAQTAPKLDANCEDVVIFMARGNDAPYHDGRTFPFVQATCDKLSQQGTSCDYIDVQFDVTYGGPYCDQVAEGARNGVSEITAFNAKCPKTKIVVNGYSQGAHVMGDVLGGPGGCSGSSTGIDNNSAAGKAIAAALLWGDVRHTANQPYNVLDGASKDKAPRTGQDLALLNRYSSVLRAYCAAGDPVCANGNVVNDHLNYFQLYTDDASSWVVSMINKRGSTSSSATPSASTLVPSFTGNSTKTAIPTGGYGNGGYGNGGYGSSSPATTGGAGNGGYGNGSGSPTSSGSKPTGGVSPTGGNHSKPSGGASAPSPSGSPPTSPNPSNGGKFHPVFPAPIPYDSCVVIYEFKYQYA